MAVVLHTIAGRRGTRLYAMSIKSVNYLAIQMRLPHIWIIEQNLRVRFYPILPTVTRDEGREQLAESVGRGNETDFLYLSCVI